MSEISIVSDDGSDDDDCCLSDGEQDLAMSSVDKASVVSLLDSGDMMEIALVRGSSIAKAKKICSLRPFTSWRDLVLYKIMTLIVDFFYGNLIARLIIVGMKMM